MNYTTDKTEKHIVSFTGEEIRNLLLEEAKKQIQTDGYNFEREEIIITIGVATKNTITITDISRVEVTLINPIKGTRKKFQGDEN